MGTDTERSSNMDNAATKIILGIRDLFLDATYDFCVLHNITPEMLGVLITIILFIIVSLISLTFIKEDKIE